MKKITFSPSFQKKLKAIQFKDQELFQKITQKLKLFQSDPDCKSLKRHKLAGKLQNVWSLSVIPNLRIQFVEDTNYYFFNIGTHDQVYKKNH